MDISNKKILNQVVLNGKIIEQNLTWKEAILLSLQDDNYIIEEMTCNVFNLKDNYPDDCVYIGRGTPYGNPFKIGVDGDRNEVCDKYEQYVLSKPELIKQIKNDLKNKNIVCHCKPLRCHGDFLLKIANEP